MVKLPVLRNTAAKNRLKVGQISDVDNLVDAMHESAHGIVGDEFVTKQHDKMLAAPRVRAFGHFQQERIRLKLGILEILVDHNDVVIVSLELENDIFLEQAEMDFVGDVDELRHNNLLILLVIDANQRGIVAEIEKTRIWFLVHSEL